MESTLVAEILKLGLAGVMILGLVLWVIKLDGRVQKLTADLLELSKSRAGADEKVANALSESAEALQQNGIILAKLSERRSRS